MQKPPNARVQDKRAQEARAQNARSQDRRAQDGRAQDIRAKDTRAKIVQAASKLFYAEGIGRVSMDAVAENAGVTKRTLYYHFDSKDDLVAAYLDARDQPNLTQMAGWFAAAEGGADAKVAAIFAALAKSARHPKWKGCGFLRTTAELAALPGHPAVKIGARHKAAFATWLAGELQTAGFDAPTALARQILLLLDGAFSASLVHRDASWFEEAGAAAGALVRAHPRQPSPSAVS
ncbi:TetR/AcrR family transcriptional regulator [Xanthobacter aminoxidans]|uniref:TetR/AcrR family transcriptional regulator n=1 Tax=Xanthobacter aminoxidans TaxID=186280 RepID=UPI002022BAD8|nr:TetR/AcrR family transcriptional regulator [Xanthobacter aminoxidans]MCL8382692.1 TetR/AcrR family transcriptional regulator [Xanthobacter aminoxidans]